MRKVIWFIVSVLLIAASYQLHQTLGLVVDISAKWACQCRFIDGGDDLFCIEEDPVGLGMMSFEFSELGQSVKIGLFGLYRSRAQYPSGQGCSVSSS